MTARRQTLRIWSRLLELLGRGYADGPAREAVDRAFASKYPELEITDVWLRAREADRDVVAVLYRDRRSTTIHSGMPLYRLFAVRADLSIDELPSEHTTSRYALRGIK